MRRDCILFLIFLIAFIAGSGTQAQAQQRIPKIGEDQFDRIRSLVMPQPGESRWRDIRWITNISEARELSLEQDKPIVIFTAADGSPLART